MISMRASNVRSAGTFFAMDNLDILSKLAPFHLALDLLRL
jgi:hypothetical protein